MGAKARRSAKIGWLEDKDVGSEVENAAVTDIQFEIQGNRLPKDHSYALFLELSRLLPWLATEEMVGIHAIHGSDIGQGELILNRRAKLVVRVPKTRSSDLMALTGGCIRIGENDLTIGKGKARSLSLHIPLYAHCVTTGSDEEVAFAKDVIRLLDEMRVSCRFICGRRQIITTATGKASGYSLMLHDLPLEQAIMVQEVGLGSNRTIGCGIFIPHKSINALS